MVEALILIVFSITAIEKSGGFIIRPNGFVIRLLMLQYERQPSCPLSYGLTDSSHVAFDWRVFFRCVPHSDGCERASIAIADEETPMPVPHTLTFSPGA